MSEILQHLNQWKEIPVNVIQPLPVLLLAMTNLWETWHVVDHEIAISPSYCKWQLLLQISIGGSDSCNGLPLLAVLWDPESCGPWQTRWLIHIKHVYSYCRFHLKQPQTVAWRLDNSTQNAWRLSKKLTLFGSNSVWFTDLVSCADEKSLNTCSNSILLGFTMILKIEIKGLSVL